ncbi:hypothetical protein [Campylobacter aviculae]|uniref:Uncharacterized protein n=1 Tax=Campylobacter aviculae TaxID=2510190 RepID=A0A4U7BPU2_9BACT|nr:hypothetical protein [Campylobacter aviculae]TKX32325.1 hypothetical protein CQA76_04395 [Campylobacter aviculae]
MITIGVLNGFGVLDYTKKNPIPKDPHPQLTNQEREQLINSFSRMQKYYEELGEKNEILDGSIEDKLRQGKLSQTEFHSLLDWINKNTQEMYWGDNYDEDVIKIFHTSKTIDEFKEKWLKLQETQKQYTEAFYTSNSISDFKNKTSENKPFKPIQAESKNKETYKDEIKNNFWEQFLKVQKENGIDILELMEKLNEKSIDKRV